MPKVKLDWVQCETFRSENAFKKSKEKNYKNLKVGKTSVNNCNVTGCDSVVIAVIVTVGDSWTKQCVITLFQLVLK